jgi:hypothetical protein
MWTDRSVVYLVCAGDDFRPQSPWDIPNSFTDAKLQARNVTLEDARATVRALNKTAVESWQANHDTWDRQWAIAVACARSKGLDKLIRVVSARVRSKGGAV